MNKQIELQVVQAILGLLAAGATWAVSYLTPRAKAWLDAHIGERNATVANLVVDGLGKIASHVVQDFNQRIVSDAKSNGAWTPQLAASVKADAVRSVLDQGSSLIEVGQSAVGNMQGLVGALVEQAVMTHHVSAPTGTTTVQPITTTTSV